MAKQAQKIITVAIGSASSVKIRATQLAFTEAFGRVKVIAIETSSGVRDQPITRAEALEGATNRAKAALHKAHADFGVGIEGGVYRSKGRYFTAAPVVVLSHDGRIGISASNPLELPPVVAAKVKRGGEVGPIMDELLGIADTKKKFGIIGYLTNGMVPRHIAYATALKVALAKFVKPEFYNK
ncbi:inosine/xanthosine triphosphatase [Candidatus Berkelbacteria bacterium]|nr:inosine/xanthosine triphosphatase [Candidatus Berkelbacteria bacterium]